MDPRPRVLKFGGAALTDGVAVRRACAIVRERGGARPIVVASAHEGVTDLLEEAARSAAAGRVELDGLRIRHRTVLAQLGLGSELFDRHFGDLDHVLQGVHARGRLLPAELDFVLSFGERMSARVLARALEAAGLPATPVDAYDLGFVTDSNHGRARLLDGVAGAVRARIDELPGIAVVTGFLGKDAHGNLTTLGRDGSDLTASVIAEAVGAEEIQFWKTVGGWLTADPRHVDDARVIAELSYAEAAEYAFHGGGVLHPDAVAPAVRARLVVRVCDVRQPDGAGTVFRDTCERDAPVGVVSRSGLVRVDWPVSLPERRAARVAEFFARLAEHGLSPGLISAGGSRVSAVVEPGPGLPSLLDALPEAELLPGVSVVAVVGEGLGAVRTLGRACLEVLQSERARVLQAFLGARAASQAVVVADEDLSRAVRGLHAALVTGALRVR